MLASQALLQEALEERDKLAYRDAVRDRLLQCQRSIVEVLAVHPSILRDASNGESAYDLLSSQQQAIVSDLGREVLTI